MVWLIIKVLYPTTIIFNSLLLSTECWDYIRFKRFLNSLTSYYNKNDGSVSSIGLWDIYWNKVLIIILLVHGVAFTVNKKTKWQVTFKEYWSSEWGYSYGSKVICDVGLLVLQVTVDRYKASTTSCDTAAIASDYGPAAIRFNI